VLERLGFGLDTLRRLNPRLVLCSITGYGQEGPAAHRAGHDLNYQAETGLLALAAGADGAPPIPPALIADIAGGAYPAVMNILLALRTAERTGQGCRLDIAMADNLFTLMYWGLAQGFAAGAWPRAGGELVTGGSPRYQIYRTADGRYLAAAPLEDRFWENFLRAIEAPQLLDPALPADQVLQQVRERIAAAPAAYWRERLEALDACCSIVATLQEAVAAPQFARLFQRRVLYGEGRGIAALPVPIDPGLRGTRPERGYPEALEDAA
jgi:alpha-methylacyl-CoA racemase